MPALKSFFIREAAGVTGEVPKLLRGEALVGRAKRSDAGHACARRVPRLCPPYESNRLVISFTCTPAQSSVGKPAFSSFITIERSVPASSTASAPSRLISVCASSRSLSIRAGVERS